MLKIEALATRLLALGIAGPFAYNRPPLQPAGCITLTEIPGGLSETEGAIDMVYLQIRSRSNKDEPTGARDTSHTIDAVLLNTNNWPVSLAGSLALSVDRLGGAPIYMDTDDQGRTTYVCNYFIRIQR